MAERFTRNLDAESTHVSLAWLAATTREAWPRSGLPASGLVPVEGPFENYRDPLEHWSVERSW